MKHLIATLILFVSFNAFANIESTSLRLVSVDTTADVELQEAVSASLLVNKIENTLTVTFFKNDAVNRVFQVLSARKFVNLEIAEDQGCGIVSMRATSEDGLTSVEVRDYTNLVCRIQVQDKIEVVITGQNYSHVLAGEALSPIFE